MVLHACCTVTCDTGVAICSRGNRIRNAEWKSQELLGFFIRHIQEMVNYVIDFSVPAEIKIARNEERKATKYPDLLNELRRMYPEYMVMVLIIGSLSAKRHAPF